jgi:hypothetical protein
MAKELTKYCSRMMPKEPGINIKHQTPANMCCNNDDEIMLNTCCKNI